MDDRLVSLLKRFELRARVFQAGPLCRMAQFDAADGLGYIHLLRAGTLAVRSPGELPPVLEEPGLLVYMNPASHRLDPGERGAELVCASFEFGSGLGNPLVRALPQPLWLPLADLPGLAAAVDLLFREAAEAHCGQQAVLDRLVEVVIVLLLRELMDQQRLQLGLLAGLADPRLARAINALHAEPAHAWTLEQLASVAGMSRARFAVRFRDVVGQTPLAYLADWRLALAQTLLRRGQPLELVAHQVGYASASALSRAFSARVGTTPGRWRRELAQG